MSIRLIYIQRLRALSGPPFVGVGLADYYYTAEIHPVMSFHFQLVIPLHIHVFIYKKTAHTYPILYHCHA